MQRRSFLRLAAGAALAPQFGSSWAAACFGCRWAVVPAGPFWLGSDAREREYGYAIGGEAARRGRWFDVELPRQHRRLPEFAIMRLLVTNDDYLAFVAATGHRAPFISEADYRKQGYLAHSYDEVRPYLWRDGHPPEGRARHPVVLVSRGDAEVYAAWLAAREGARYRLPTEEDWEKAARGEDARYFPWGDRWDPRLANTGYRFGGTTEVGRFPDGASPYGCLDMCGNVFEWTGSDFSDGKAVMKGGGSWDDEPGICRAAARHGRMPGARHILFGFRLACELH